MTDSSSSVLVRTLTTIEDFLNAEEVQREIWGMQNLVQVIPLHVLLTAQENGGLVASSFDSQGQMTGILFGFIGLTPEGQFKHCSHLMGVLPAVRRQNHGQAMKLFQREYVLAQGLDLVTWTFDPMEGVNASLNIAKLGGITRHYMPNHYGNSMGDALNRDLPTDRFDLEWWINSPHVASHLAGRERPSRATLNAEYVFDTKLDEDGALHVEQCKLDLTADTLLLEIPMEFQAIKLVSMDLAREWRHFSSEAFLSYFARGYTVSDFISDRNDGRRRNFYVLSKNFTV